MVVETKNFLSAEFTMIRYFRYLWIRKTIKLDIPTVVILNIPHVIKFRYYRCTILYCHIILIIIAVLNKLRSLVKY